MYNDHNSSPTVTSCDFGDNTASDSGGGMYNVHSSPTVTDCDFRYNTASHGGAMSNNSSTPTVTDCKLWFNTATHGGGMYNYDSNATVTDCNFRGNWADSDGGGMENVGSSPTVTDCNFSENTASDSGGGMYNLINSSPTVTNCTFSGNSASSSGGGMYNDDSSSPTVTDCNFTANSAGFGGGMHNFYYSSPLVTNCTFSGNLATDPGNGHGGGMGNWNNCSPTLTNCIFSGNFAADFGGGIGGAFDSSPTLINCTFSANYAVWAGGGMFISSTETVINCTFSSNSAGESGGGIHNYWGSSPTVTNCILWGNTPDEIFNDATSSSTVTYSDVQGGWPGMANIDADPWFVDAGAGNFRLASGSPCIDAGDNTAVPALVITDLDGNPRIADGNNDGNPVVDMGAYELATPPVPPVPVTMKFTPQALNTCSNGKAKAHFLFPEEYEVEGINATVPATLSLLGVEVQSEEIKILGAKKKKGPVKVQITFYRAGLCVIETDEDYADVTVTGYFSNGRKYMGTDTIKIITNR